MTTVLGLTDVGVRTAGQALLASIDWKVERGQHWVVLGPNGAGKTTLLRVAAGLRLPTSGSVEVLGERVGRVDLRALRRRIGIVSSALDDLVDRRSPVRHVVAAAIAARTAPLRDDLAPPLLARADAALARVELTHLADRIGATMSVGEWQRVLLARALVLDPDLLLLDEPFAGLDLAQREHLLAHLDRLLAAPDAPTTVVITHHLEEVPRAVSHAMLLRDGRVVAAGPTDEALTDGPLSTTYGLPVTATRHDGRWTATATSS